MWGARVGGMQKVAAIFGLLKKEDACYLERLAKKGGAGDCFSAIAIKPPLALKLAKKIAQAPFQ